MDDVTLLLLAIWRGQLDSHLAAIAEALAQRQSDLNDYQLAAAALAGYVELSGVSVEELLESLKEE